MGLLDIPAPLFGWMDKALLGAFDPLVRLALWAFFISALSMAAYVLLSPQKALRQLKTDMRSARRELREYDGDFDGVAGLARRNIGLSLRHLRLVAPAALMACIPVIMLIVWLAKSYGAASTDSGLPLQMDVTGGPARLRVIDPAGMATQGGTPVLAVFDRDGGFIADTPLNQSVRRLEKHRWWHWLSGNPAGYLPPGAPIEAVELRWPRNEVHAMGPGWARGWEAPFLALAVLFTLGIQAAFRIE